MTEAIRVLHVDDEPDFADLTADYLERKDDGLRVDTATNAREGLDRLQSEDYDCIISDYDMPRRNGIELLQTVRETHSDLPFILFTGKGSEEVASEAISAGVTDYLQKEGSTHQFTVLANRVRNAVSAYRSARDAERRRHRLEQLLKTVPACVVQIDSDGQFVFANDRAEKVLGLEPEAVRERTYNDPQWKITDLSGDPIPDTELPFRRVQDTGEPLFGYRHTIQWPDGTRKALLVNGAPLFDSEGSIESTIFALSDITGQIARERNLERYQKLVETVGDPMYVLDRDGYIEMVNRAMLEYLKVDESEVIGAHITEFITDGDAEEATEFIQDLLDDPKRGWGTIELTALTPQGDQIPAEVNIAILTDDTGDYHGSVGVVRDIRARKEYEAQMEEMTTRMQLALSGANSWIWEWDIQTDTVTQSAVSGLLGVEEDEITRPIEDFLEQLHPDDREIFLAAKEQALSEERDYHVEFRLLGDDGSRWIESRGQLYDGDLQDSACLIGIATDVTEQKQRAVERQWMQRAFDQSSEAMFVSDPETARIEFVNDRACDLLNYDREELLDMSVFDIQPEFSTMAEWRDHVDRLRTEGHYPFEGFHRRRDGTKFPVEVSAELIEIGRREHVLGLARDVSHRKERERELQRQIERLDEFTSIVSHDLRNPLNVAKGRLQLMSEDCDSEHIVPMERSLQRMGSLIEDLLTLAQEGEPSVDVEPLDVANLVDSCWQTVETKDANLQVEANGVIRADWSRVQQLFENLFRNAVEHGGADVTVTVGALANGCGLYVEDDGPGIPEDDRQEVFETGFTTNDSGTGFGLAIATKIAEAHGWSITITEGPECGARFEITDVEISGE